MKKNSIKIVKFEEIHYTTAKGIYHAVIKKIKGVKSYEVKKYTGSDYVIMYSTVPIFNYFNSKSLAVKDALNYIRQGAKQ